MDNLPSGPLKPRVLALVAAGEAQRLAFVDQLSAAERGAPGAPDAWAAKDHVAHIAAWTADAARIVGAAARGETPAPSPESTELNPQVFAAQQHRSWAAILADGAAANAALRAAIEACSEADLTDRTRFPWREGAPLWYEAFVSGFDHPSEHYEQFYLEAGDAARATTVRQAAVDTARPLIGETNPYTWMVYKLGCLYAKVGRPGPALPALREGLAREPRLSTWMAAEPEFAALHADPAFQALLAEATGEPGG